LFILYTPEHQYISLSYDIPHYRNLFNGQEVDNEVYGEGAVLGYEFRQYDTRIGRWWSVDPMADNYPSTSHYAFCRNNPILFMDPNGAFDTRAEARQYRKDHHTGGIIKKNSARDIFAGKYSIDNRRKQLSYTKPQYVEKDVSIHMVGLSSDGVVTSPIANDPRTRREKMDDFDRELTQKGAAVGQGMATALPITSQVNDIMIISTGENMFGDKASESDKAWATIDLATFGVGKTFKLLEKSGVSVFEKAANTIESIGMGLNIRSGISTTKDKLKNGEKGKE